MNETTTIANSAEHRISFYHLAIFIVMLPFDRFYSELVLISLLIHSLIYLNKEKVKAIFSRQNLILVSVFLVGIIGFAWSSDDKQAIKDLQRQLAILLFPIIFSLMGLDLSRYRKKLFLVLGVTCIATILYLYIDALRIILYYKMPLRSIFSPSFINHNFSAPIDLHATYFSMYISLALAAFLFYLFESSIRKEQLLLIFGIGILLAGLVQLASRSVLIATMLLIIPGVSFYMLRGKKRLQFAGVWLIVLGIAVLGISKMDSFKKRYVENLKNDLTQASVNNEVLEPRLLRWKYVWHIIKEKPVLGHGPGSEKRLLTDTYYENKLYNSYLNELNAHNQYLSFWLKTGILGLLIFLFTLCYAIADGWRKRDLLQVAFLALIAIVCFSENILDVNKGIFFYAFFLSFFVKGRFLRK